MAKIRDAVAAKTDVPGPNVLVCCTHTHTGPRTRRARLDDIKEDTTSTTAWLDDLPGMVAQAVAEACANVEPCTVASGVAMEDRIAFNRCRRMKDGSVRTNPGHQNPDIIEPAAPIDPEVGVLSFTRADGTTKALFVNYTATWAASAGRSCRPTTPGT